MKEWLITGSVAMQHWYQDFNRKPFDIDILTPCKIKLGNAEEYKCIVETHWTPVFEELLKRNKHDVFLDQDLLYTLKVSHAHWNIKWNKTMWDINFMQERGARLDHSMYALLVPVWEEIHGKKRAYLNVSNEEFFQDSVDRVHDHDYLHRIVAFNSKPMFEELKDDLNKAYCSPDKFNLLSAEKQLETAMEEIIVTAIERGGLTDKSYNTDKLSALSKAHFQLVTSMTKGWFALFLIQNHRNILQKGKEKCLKQMDKALQILSK